jgi:hypothetical protein
MNLLLNPTQPAVTSQMTPKDDGKSKQPSAGTEPGTTNPRQVQQNLAKAPFDLNNAAKVLISNLSQNGGKVEGLEILTKNTQQDLTPKGNQIETDTFTARFQGNPIIISIEKDLISAADGNNMNQVGMPNKVIISSGGDSVTTTSQELGGKMQDSYLGEGKLYLINFNLNKSLPKEIK